MKELWQENNKLICKKKWIEFIDDLNINHKFHNKNEVKIVLQKKLISAIKNRLPKKKIGIFFSGGVDSTFIAAIAKLLQQNFICYAVGFKDNDTKEPEDIVEAKKVARKLNFKLKYKIYNLKEAESIIKKTIKILKQVDKTDVVNIGVGSVILAATELAQQDNIEIFFSGLGSEEIFAGYERHEKAKDKIGINEECWNGLKQMWERDLVRDYNLAINLGIKIKTPFLDKELISYTMQLPEEWKIVDEQKKVILREVAEEFLGKFAWRKKKAAQYGSCFDKAIAKLTKKNGFKLKKDYLDYLNKL